jgi:hypothetical protein
MKNIYITFIFFTLLVIPSFALNAGSEIKGVSLGEYSTCDYYLIEDTYGDFSLVEWYGGATTYSGDIIYGDLHSYGFKDLYDATLDSQTRVYIDDWLLSESRATEKLIDKCGYKGSIEKYLSGSSGGYYTSPTPSYSPSSSSCVTNASYSNGKCSCDNGYIQSGNTCITYTQSCKAQYGSGAYGDASYCHCSSGYEFNSGQTACVVSLICPLNSTKLGNTCITDEGYINRNGQNITYTEDCRLSFGAHTIGTKGNDGNSSCDCETTHEWNGTKTACVEKPVNFDVPAEDIEAVQQSGVVNTSSTLRQCPSKQCSKIKNYPTGYTVKIIGKYKKGTWLNIEETQDQNKTTTGWIHESLIDKTLEVPKPEIDLSSKYVTRTSDSPEVEKVGWLKNIWRSLFGN